MENLIICYILLFYIIYQSYKNSSLQSLSGYWESDENFNKEAGINTMILYIGEINGTYFANTTIYMIIDPVYIGGAEWSLRAVPWSNKIGVNINYDNDKEEKIFGNHIIMDVDKDQGCMRLFSQDGILYGLLFKNNMLSNYSSM